MTPTRCPDCHGQQRLTTADGHWTYCGCWWRERILRSIPADLHGGSPYLPAEVTAMAPWPLDEDRFEQGSWDEFRQQATWSLAAHMGAGHPPASVALIDNKRLRCIEFGEDSEYVGSTGALIWGPKAPHVLVLIGGSLEHAMHANVVHESLVSLIRTRQLHHKTVWGFRLEASYARLEVFPGDRQQRSLLLQAPATQATLPAGAPRTGIAVVSRGGKLTY
jgi:hypothetical protein